MTKIKIIEKEVEIEGQIEKGRVTPFGTAAHIPFKKRHMAKVINVVVPNQPKYIWILNDKEKLALFKSVRKNIEKENGKLRHYRLGLIDELKNNEFDIDSLIKILEFVDNKKLVNKIKSLYNIN